MDNNVLLLIAALQGILLPFVVSFLKGQQWSSNVKMFFSMAVSVVVSGLTLFVTNDFDWDYLVANAAVVWASAQVVYKTWFESTTTEVRLASMLPWSKPGV